jgi:endonuclease III
MFALAEEGHRSLVEQVVACILSIRTRDEVSLVAAAQRLFAAVPTAAAIAGLDLSALDRLIGDTSFHAAKAVQIREIARRAERDHGGTLPCDASLVWSLRGVGPKCAHLALGVACGQSHISVDIHVHRVTNRWATSRPALQSRRWRCWKHGFRVGIGSRSTRSWCRSASTSAPAHCRTARRVPCWRCAGRLASTGTDRPRSGI